jgi:hypothetical protein
MGVLFLMAATTATTTREVEAVTNAVDSGSLGRIFSVSVLQITGASKLMPYAHNL